MIVYSFVLICTALNFVYFE